MKLVPASLAAALLGCSDFTTTEAGVARLDVLAPVPAEVEVAQSVVLRAVALGAEGDTLDIPIYWRALDTTLAVDSVAGRVTGLTAGQTGRVVARAADLYSAIITFSVLNGADTLVRVADSSLTVAAGETASAELAVRVEAGDPPMPVQGRRITFELVHPAFPTAEDRSVEFAGGLLAIAPRSSALGTPEQPVTLRRRSGRAQPDTAIVQVSVYRPDGTSLPGSGLRFYILFD